MRTWLNKLVVMSMLLVLCTSGLQANWWIFGTSKQDVDFKYLYINNISFDETDQTLTLFTESLTDGQVTIRGKALPGRKIGTVKISLDNQTSWQPARMTKDGAFEFTFPAEPGTYPIHINMIDVAGKSNDIERTARTLVISDESMISRVEQVLDQLSRTYRDKDRLGFLRHVSQDFAGDEMVLDAALEKDFSNFDQIQLRLVVRSIAQGRNGRIVAAINFSRSLVCVSDLTTYTDSGTSEFVFENKQGQLALYSMRIPLIFGVSDAQNVASGVSYGSGNTELLVVDGSGGVSVVDFSTGVAGGSGESGDPSVHVPQNLYTGDGLAGHWVDLYFDDPGFSLLGYDLVIEEATSSSGPWNEIDRRPGDFFARIDYPGDVERIFLFYRVRLSTGGKDSLPSNVVSWDNR